VGLQKDLVAKIMVEELRKHIESGTRLKKVIFVDINKEQVEAFRKEVGVLI
jgi:O-acetyl-ADP-ribose deacetylase (regulator of RNase III)